MIVDHIPVVEPLDAQMGVYPLLDVPAVLDTWLFDKTNASAPLNTFALLDACRVPFLPERLPSSGLEWRCLFIGEAEKELADVAPYLVQLRQDNNFTRSMFSASGSPSDMWLSQPGIFLRTGADIGTLVKHFRKFVRLYDEDRHVWFYFRFFAPETLRTMITAMEDHAFTKFCGPVTSLMGQTNDGGMIRLHRPIKETADAIE